MKLDLLHQYLGLDDPEGVDLLWPALDAPQQRELLLGAMSILRR